MAHKHSVRDVGAHFLIDQFTRQIKNDSANKTTIVQYDHNSERLTFEIPLYVDGHAMTLCDLIEIHYINISTDGNSQNPGTYEVNDIKAEGENAVFTWLISQECTQLAGSLNFFIVFKCTENGVTVYRWGTEIFKNLPISAGMDNGEAVLTEYPDILAQWKAQLFSASDTAVLNVATAEANALAAIEAAGEAKKQAVLESIPDEYEELQQDVGTNAARINELANAIKGELSGAVVRADDVSLVEHNPAIWVHGKNLFNNAKIETILTNYGSGETIDTGVRATVTNAGTWRYAMLKVIATKKLIGKNLTLSFSAVASAMNTPRVAFGFADSTGNDRIQPAISLLYTDAITITVTKEYASQYEFVAIWLYSNHTGTGNVGDYIDYTNLQVEIGDTATDYEAYIDPATVTVRRCGKNIIPYPYSETELTRAGVTWKTRENGKVAASGTTPTEGSYISVITSVSERLFLAKGVTYHFSCIPKESGLYYAYVKDASGTNFFDRGNGVTFTPTESGFAAVTIVVSSEVTVSDVAFCPLLEIGSEKTVFEPPCAESTYVPTSEGAIPALTSLSPCMTILTDTEGVTVECEYNRDTNKVIADILEQIEALKNA